MVQYVSSGTVLKLNHKFENNATFGLRVALFPASLDFRAQ